MPSETETSNAPPPGKIFPSILVVDDGVEILRFLRETLGSLTACAVDAFPNSERAFELSLCKQYGFLLFDFSLPTMDAALLYGLIRKVYDLVAVPARPLPPLILMSGRGEQQRAQQLLREPGVRSLLPKPFSIDRLLGSIEKCLPGATAVHPPAARFRP